jgi:hypothetical protein
VLLWSCETGRGARGAAFLAALAQASGASVAAATGRVGGAALGRGWALDGAPALRAPLIARSTGWGSKGKPTSGTWNTTTNDVAPTVVVSVASSNLKAGQDGSDRLQLQRAGGRLHQQPRDRVGRHARRPLPGHPDALLATFTPDANVDATIQVAASAVPGSGAPVWFDLAGNPGTASNTVSISEDTKAPTASSIAASGAGITNGNAISMRAKWSR